jgi:hypothetical protein
VYVILSQTVTEEVRQEVVLSDEEVEDANRGVLVAEGGVAHWEGGGEGRQERGARKEHVE